MLCEANIMLACLLVVVVSFDDDVEANIILLRNTQIRMILTVK